MNIKSIRLQTNLTQAAFAEKYGIPLQTLKQWESDSSSKSHRKPPVYIEALLEKTIVLEKEAEKSKEQQKLRYLVTAARESRYHAKQWYRYLRKEFSEDRFVLSDGLIGQLLAGDDLTMFQKISLTQAAAAGSPTNLYISSLNKPAATGMVDEIMRKYQ